MAEPHGAEAVGGSHAAQEGPHEAHGDHIHMPPNSWSPISLSFALTMTMVGFVSQPWVWIVGLVWTIASLVAWARAARTEYLELPD